MEGGLCHGEIVVTESDVELIANVKLKRHERFQNHNVSQINFLAGESDWSFDVFLSNFRASFNESANLFSVVSDPSVHRSGHACWLDNPCVIKTSLFSLVEAANEVW
jgi:hypothetical protein